MHSFLCAGSINQDGSKSVSVKQIWLTRGCPLIWEYRHLPQKWSCFDRKTVAERHSYWMELVAVRAKTSLKSHAGPQARINADNRVMYLQGSFGYDVFYDCCGRLVCRMKFKVVPQDRDANHLAAIDNKCRKRLKETYGLGRRLRWRLGIGAAVW